jgi:hypothetical protein
MSETGGFKHRFMVGEESAWGSREGNVPPVDGIREISDSNGWHGTREKVPPNGQAIHLI